MSATNSIRSKIEGDLETTETTANKFVSGFAAIVPADSVDVLTYTVPAAKTLQLLGAKVSATGDFKHELILNGTTINSAQSSFMDRNSDLTLPASLVAGDVLKIKSTSRTVFGTTNEVEAFICGKE